MAEFYLGIAAVALLLLGCAGPNAQIKRLSPVSETSKAPPECKIAGVLPDSPAGKVGIMPGERILTVNGTQPANATTVADLIDQSADQADIELAGMHGPRHLKVSLNSSKPRLGALCDLTGYRKPGLSAAGNESVTVFSGPYALTLSGIIDHELIFMRVRLNNYADHSLDVSPAVFSAVDAQGKPVTRLSPEDVMRALHGEQGVALVKPPSGKSSTDSNSPPSPRYNDRIPHAESSTMRANADYVNEESLWPKTLDRGETADGLIYFAVPAALPLNVTANIDGRTLKAGFGIPQPAAGRMSQDDIAHFLEQQKKGTPIKLTLRNGKVFIGKFASYDDNNEIVWFDTPRAGLVNTTSYGLKAILAAEPVDPASSQKLPAGNPIN